MVNDPNARFDRLLKAMVSGPAPASGKRKPSAGPASNAEDGACYDDTRAPPDTSEDATS